MLCYKCKFQFCDANALKDPNADFNVMMQILLKMQNANLKCCDTNALKDANANFNFVMQMQILML